MFGLFKRQRTPDQQARSYQGDPTFVLGPLLQGALGSDALKDPYSNHATVFRCISVLADNLSSVEFRLYTGSDKDKSEVLVGPWYDLFLRPNPQMSRRDLWEATIVFMSLRPGECFWILEGKGSDYIREDEIPTEIWPVPGHCVTEILDDSGLIVEGWRVVDAAGRSVEYPAHAVVQFKRHFNPNNRNRGISPIEAAATGIRQDAKASSYNEAFFENSGIPGGVVSFEEPLDREVVDSYRRQISDRHQGSAKAHRTLVLAHGGKFNVVASTHKEMTFIEQRRWHRGEVAMCFGVPTWFLGDTEGLNYSISREAKRALWENTLVPLVRKMQDTLEARLFHTRTTPEERAEARVNGGRAIWGGFDLSTVQALLRDEKDLLDIGKGMRDLGWTANEINMQLGLNMPNQGDDGDIRWAAPGMVPVEVARQGGGLGMFGGLGAAGISLPFVQPIQGESLIDPDEIAFEDRGRNMLTAMRRNRLWRDVVERAMDPTQLDLEDALKAHFHRIRRDLLKAVKTERDIRAPNIDAILKSLQSKWDEALAERLEPIFREGIERAAESLARQLGRPLTVFDMQSPKVIEFLRDKAIKVTGINETLREALRGNLAEGLANAETTVQLQDRVRKSLNVAQGRVPTIARTESAGVINGARAVAMEAEGIERIEWVSVLDGHTRDSHRALDGKIVDIGESFKSGITLRHPGDMEAPASEACECRCITAPTE